MDLAKFEWLVTKRSLYFRRADLFEDPLEGTLPSANRKIGRFFGFRLDPESPTGAEFNAHKERIWRQFRRWMYVNCWYHGNQPSAEMWTRFGAGGTGVAICSSFARMALALERTGRTVWISEVEYRDPEELPVSERNLAAALVRKSRSYATEQEVRMFLSKVPTGTEATFWGEPRGDHVSIPVILPHLISSISFGPNASATTRDHVELLLPLGQLGFAPPL
jgi:hypothetical protein